MNRHGKLQGVYKKFAVDQARPRPSAHHTCFSTLDRRFAALSYRRPGKLQDADELTIAHRQRGRVVQLF